MIRTVLIFFVSLGYTPIMAQNANFIWAKKIGVSLLSQSAIATDAAGNVFTTGVFGGTVDFDPGPGVLNLTAGGAGDAFISKLDAAGNLVWARQITGIGIAWSEGKDIAVDGAGNAYITGGFTDTADFDPGPALLNLNTVNGADIFIWKLDPSGNLLWTKQMKSTGYHDNFAISITLDVSGNVYTTGTISGATLDFDPGPSAYNLTPTGTRDLFILKLDAAGNFIWARAMGGMINDRIESRSIAVDALGNVYTTGSFSGGAPDFDPGPGTFIMISSMWISKTFLSKLDASGNFAWAKQLVGIINPNILTFGAEGRSIKLDNQNNIYVSGRFAGSVDFDPGPGTSALSSNHGEGFISKYSNSGNLIWATNTSDLSLSNSSSLWTNSMTLDAAGNIFVTGWFRGAVDFDPGLGSFVMSGVNGGDCYISKFNSSGIFAWAKQLAGDTTGTGLDITVDAINNIYTTGVFSGTVDFNPGIGVYNLNSIGVKTVFALKLGPCASAGTTVINATACDSYTFNNLTYDSSGTYTFLLQNTSGCDSLVMLNLTITHAVTTISASACNSYTWNGQTYTGSGSYSDTLQTASGCDSIVTLNLSIYYNVNSPLSISACKSYNWNGQTYYASGVYSDTLTTVNGCDSIVTLNLTLKQSTSSTVVAAICPGDNYDGHSTPGFYIDTLVSTNGCDSIRSLQLSYQPLNTTTVNAAICQGETYLGYNASGIYIDTLNGCNVRRLNLAVSNNCIPIAIPNAFTPNNDGLNDRFRPIIHGAVSEYRFRVFNRWGQVVFETTDHMLGWDGSFNGKPQPGNTYIYSIHLKDNSGKEKDLKGSVQLIR